MIGGFYREIGTREESFITNIKMSKQKGLLKIKLKHPMTIIRTTLKITLTQILYVIKPFFSVY